MKFPLCVKQSHTVESMLFQYMKELISVTLAHAETLQYATNTDVDAVPKLTNTLLSFRRDHQYINLSYITTKAKVSHRHGTDRNPSHCEHWLSELRQRLKCLNYSIRASGCFSCVLDHACINVCALPLCVGVVVCGQLCVCVIILGI